jgi:dipeptidyl aminopeptidase/acylaminoacyl peptidase
VKRELERIEIPGEHDARVRAWEVVRAAHAEREPAPRRLPLLRPALVAAAVAAIVAAALSPPGRAVVEDVRKAIGLADSEEALFALPTRGKLLVVAPERGAYVVHPDGSRRRLGRYQEATWSPRGRFVVATRVNGLFALTPEGNERWSLRRRDVSGARWGGTQADTRIAYTSGRELRVVAGDRKDDRTVDPRAGGAPVAWKPGGAHVLAYRARDRIAVVAADTRRVLWRSQPLEVPAVEVLEWSADGKRLLAVSPRTIRVFDGQGRLVREMPMRAGTFALGAEFAPNGHVFALRAHSVGGPAAGRSQVLLVNADRAMRPRQLFIGLGAFGDLAWSPDGRWILLDWIGADQWLFIRTRGMPKIVPVSNIRAQFGSAPHLLDWGP